MKYIFVVNGLPHSGKTEFENMVAKYAKTEILSSVDFVKEVAKFAGWDGVKDDRGRLFLSQLKSIMTIYDDIPFKIMKKKVKEFRKSDSEILFLDIREIDEIKRAVRKFGAQTILVKRPNNRNLISNDSDRYVECYDNYTYLLNNDSGLEELEDKAHGFVEYLRGIYNEQEKNICFTWLRK